MSTKKQVPATTTAEVVTTTTTIDEKKRPTVLETAELTVLSHMVASSYEKASPEEKAMLNSIEMKYPEAIMKTLTEKGVVEKNDKGAYVPTSFGIRWVLDSRSFGHNFVQIFKRLNLSALHSAFFAMANELAARHEEAQIYYRTQTGELSSFWAKFDEAVGQCDSCLQESDDPADVENA